MKKIIGSILISTIIVACNDGSDSSSSAQENNNNSVKYNQHSYNKQGFRNYNMDGAKDALNSANYVQAASPVLNIDPNFTYIIDATAVPVGYGCNKGQITKGGTEIQLQPAVMTTSAENLRSRRNQYDPLVQMAAATHSLDPNFIHGIISQESAYQPNIEGPPTKWGTAKGMMQLIDATAKAMGVTFAADIFRADVNINAGSKYLATNMKRFNGNLALVAAAYNAGPGHITNCGNRISPYANGQTLDYVQKVIGYADAVHKSNQQNQRRREN